ncbi:hypothetical protein EDB81DRAFT_824085 [Dactylonectria macrodidyma]|uniref:BTB domain-containing protein n=1 Tax=Dactylonectria macrodidyma TaxID=307937 RepID=A0A9P9IBX4_9HYPO|nr:hypothetical protein EDB81DRAFT_824085 [Dactylonectria macrodidyma]
MPPLSYEVDPQADVKLILQEANTQILLPLATSISLMTTECSQTSAKLKMSLSKSPCLFSTTTTAASNLFQPLTTTTTAASNPFQPSTTSTGVTNGLGGATDPLISAWSALHFQLEDDSSRRTKIRFQVSSRHLTLASPIFRAMLDGPWKEGTASKESLRSIMANTWDVDALLIVLNIIHGHHRKVPKSLSLEMLTKVSTIVDYYNCHEIVEIFADRWLNGMARAPPDYYGRDSTLFLCVAWVFRWSGHVKAMTELALRHGEGPIETPDLPIAGILEKIDEKRQDLIDQLFNALDDLRDSLSKGEDVCSYECSSMLLGSLVKEMYKIRHISPPATRPYNGYSVAGLMQRMSDFRLPVWYSLKDLSPKGRNMHCCNLVKKIQPIVSDVEKKITDFRLEDF